MNPLTTLIKQRPLRMTWRVRRGGQPDNLLFGTAHFFPYSFLHFIRGQLRKVSKVWFEGPLDQGSMSRFAQHGQDGGEHPNLVDLLDPEAARRIDRRLCRQIDSTGKLEIAYLLNPNAPPATLRALTDGQRPWKVFFSLWSTCLGWEYSVDMEGYQSAKRLRLPVDYLETVNEQMQVLESIPLERIVNQLNDVDAWDAMQQSYVDYFLCGDLDALLALYGRFPTRTPEIVNDRDRRLFVRLLPDFERGGAAAFVGVPHVPGISTLLIEAGFEVEQLL